MLFAVESVHWACSMDLDDPQVFSEMGRRLLGGRAMANDHAQMVRAWLKELPPAEEQAKIVNRLKEIAQQGGCTLSEPCWWDIVPHDRILLALLEPPRPSRILEVMFLWRRTDKSISPSMLFTPSPMEFREYSPMRVNFEAPTYQEVKAQFKHWLAALPEWVMDPTRDA